MKSRRRGMDRRADGSTGWRGLTLRVFIVLSAGTHRQRGRDQQHRSNANGANGEAQHGNCSHIAPK